MIEFTRNGVKVDTFNDIFDRLNEGLRAAYGNDVTVEQDSQDGQWIGIDAKGNLDLQSFLLDLYNNLDPDFATGAMQDVILKFSGLTRRPASKSTVDVTVTADKSLTLAAGYKRKDTLGQEWETTSDYSIIAGANVVSFESTEWGAIEAAPNTITEPSTIVLGIVATTNPSAATVGNNEETEAQVRLRRKKSLENPAFSTLGATTSKLIGLDGVLDVAPYENKTKIYDSVRDIDGNTEWFVVNGGDEAEIIKNIAIQKTGGCDTKGAISGTYSESYERQDGSTRIHTYTENFDRPDDIPVYVKANAKRRVTGESVDTAAIASSISTRIFYIADYLQANELYQQGYMAGTNYVLYDLEISLDGITYVDEELFSGYGGLFSIDVANINITEVI